MLEDRTAPAVFNFTGLGGNTLWEQPGNWDQPGVPSSGDEVNLAGHFVTSRQDDIYAYSVTGDGELTVNGSLMVSTSLTVGILHDFGSVMLCAHLSSEGSATLDLRGQLHLTDDSYFTLAGASRITGTEGVINGKGLVDMPGDTSLMITGNATLKSMHMLSGNTSLIGPGTLNITGTLVCDDNHWIGAGTLNVLPGAQFNTYTYNTLDIHGWTINNYGITNLTEGIIAPEDSTFNNYSTFNCSAVVDATNSVFNNYAGATFNMARGATAIWTINNDGTFNWWVASEIDSTGSPLNNKADGVFNITPLTAVTMRNWTINNDGITNRIGGPINSQKELHVQQQRGWGF